MALREIIAGIALPAIIAAIILAGAWRAWRGRGGTSNGQWAGASAVAAGVAASYLRVVGLSHFPPVEPDNWIVYFAVVAAVLGWADTRLAPSLTLRVPVVLALASGYVALLLWPLVPQTVAASRAGFLIPGLGVLLLLWWLSLERAAQGGSAAGVACLLALLAEGGMALLNASGLGLRGVIAAALMAIAVAVLVVSLITGRRFSLARGAVMAFVGPLFGLLIYGYFYAADDPTPRLTAAYGLLGVAPLMAMAADLPAVRRLHPVPRSLLRFAAVAVFVVASQWLAVSSSAGDPPATSYRPLTI